MDTQLVKALREAAMKCSNADYQKLLRMEADVLARYIAAFSMSHSEAALRSLNGEWAYAKRILDNVPPEAPPAPLSGAPEPARLAA